MTQQQWKDLGTAIGLFTAILYGLAGAFAAALIGLGKLRQMHQRSKERNGRAARLLARFHRDGVTAREIVHPTIYNSWF